MFVNLGLREIATPPRGWRKEEKNLFSPRYFLFLCTHRKRKMPQEIILVQEGIPFCAIRILLVKQAPLHSACIDVRLPEVHQHYERA